MLTKVKGETLLDNPSTTLAWKEVEEADKNKPIQTRLIAGGSMAHTTMLTIFYHTWPSVEANRSR